MLHDVHQTPSWCFCVRGWQAGPVVLISQFILLPSTIPSDTTSYSAQLQVRGPS